MTMKARLFRRVFATVAITCAMVSSSRAQNAVVGVNIVNPYTMSSDALDAMLSDLKAAGVHVVRASITPNDKGVDLAQRAWQKGIKIEWMIFRFGGYEPGGAPLSSADPEQFRATYTPILSKLEEKGITLAAFELGNEINLAGYNSEFPRTGRGVQFGLKDLQSDPEAGQVAKGYLQYLKVLAVLKDMRDHSKLNQKTPILTAGLAAFESDDGPQKGAKNDMVSANATLKYLQANGIDRLVDGYAVHVYPSGDAPGDPSASARRSAGLAKYVLAECQSAGSGQGKPCWITEWGFKNLDQACPVNDNNRAMLVQEMMGTLRSYVEQGRVAGVIYFPWNTDSPYSIFRCGSLTKSGQIAINGSLLR